ncbi:MAG: TetR/AcrR family transcriptional regulator, partial [Spirochaetes bacterium]|nr:TetR/AcrR family transcriptional regulator [Spirochaetota bacterium]
MSDKTKSNQRGMEIIRAASEVFSLYGYGKTSLDDIASALNITRSALYYYHRNKDDLFLAVIDNWLHDYRLELEKAIAGEMTTEHRLEIFCRCYLDYRLKFFKINKFNDDDYPVPFDLLKRIKSRSISLQVSIITGILERDDALKDIE